MVLCLFYPSIPVYLFVMPKPPRTFMPFLSLFPGLCFERTAFLYLVLRALLLVLILCLVMGPLLLSPAISYYPYTTCNDNA